MKKIILIILFPFNLYASTFFAPDSDTALLIQLLGTEIEATAGILQILDISSETVEKIDKYHQKVEDYHSRAMQAEYYANTIANFPETIERIKSISSLHSNLEKANNLIDDGKNLEITKNFVKETNAKVSKIASSNIKSNIYDKKLALHYIKQASKASKSIDGSLVSARSSALSSYKLTNISENLDLLNYQIFASNHYLVSEKEKQASLAKAKNKRWGIVKVKDDKK